MQKTFLPSLVLVLFLIASVPTSESKELAPTPLPPNAGKPAPEVVEAKPVLPENPVRLHIPSISLSSEVDALGINSKGEMEVPDGSTNKVGWYKDGTIPGEVGSAVLDAHVYAAFKKLKYVNLNDDIYVETTSGKQLHFKVTDSRVYKLGELTPDYLFNRKDAKRLNLITCAGTYSKKLGTYTHRLVVYAELVE
jgi:sortase A